MAKTTKNQTTPSPEEHKNPEQEAPEYDWSREQTTGFENVAAQDLGIPFLMILQAMSPEVNRSDADYESKKIKGAQPGSIINTVAREVYYQPDENPMLLIPCGYDRKWIEWKPRTKGGGFVKPHADERIMEQTTKDPETGNDTLRNGNIIRATAYFFVLVAEIQGVKCPEPIRAVIGMSSTQLRNARIWLNIMYSIKMPKAGGGQFTPPMFSHFYAVGTKPESNEKGSWMGWKIESAGPVKNVKLIDNARETATKIVADAKRLLAAPPATKEEDDAVPFQ